uniref:Uncharacterized protein n=1 Tax=Anguilla anguilla TaxID=7936 RepID=A0A0E9V983_ANGAN
MTEMKMYSVCFDLLFLYLIYFPKYETLCITPELTNGSFSSPRAGIKLITGVTRQ